MDRTAREIATLLRQGSRLGGRKLTCRNLQRIAATPLGKLAIGAIGTTALLNLTLPGRKGLPEGQHRFSSSN